MHRHYFVFSAIWLILCDKWIDIKRFEWPYGTLWLLLASHFFESNRNLLIYQIYYLPEEIHSCQPGLLLQDRNILMNFNQKKCHAFSLYAHWFGNLHFRRNSFPHFSFLAWIRHLSAGVCTHVDTPIAQPVHRQSKFLSFDLFLLIFLIRHTN